MREFRVGCGARCLLLSLLASACQSSSLVAPVARGNRAGLGDRARSISRR
jgi:hypothetical protein